jgi:hypothetical protein
MKLRSGAVWAALACLAPAAPALARDYHYFHKADVPRERYAEDRAVCDRLAGGVDTRTTGSTTIMVPQYSNLSAGANAASVAIASLFAGLMLRNQNKHLVGVVERTCMADKGYARYKVEKGLVQEIDRLPNDEARVERYFALATASTPVGQRIKE